MIPDSRGGKIVNVTPAAPTVRAALENLARVLSIEWARFDIKLTAIASVDPQETAWLAAFLASPAGDYVSGAVRRLRQRLDANLAATDPGGLRGATPR